MEVSYIVYQKAQSLTEELGPDLGNQTEGKKKNTGVTVILHSVVRETLFGKIVFEKSLEN
jgi:hypothetical protein